MLFNRKTESETDRWPAHSFEPDPRSALHRSDGVRARSIIDPTLAIVGDLQTEGDLQVDGHICGNVQCAQLIVGRNAAITGAVRAEEAVIRGRITGTISANVIIVQGTAHVKADIVYNQLAVDEGAAFEGAVRRSARPLEEEGEARATLADLKRMIPAPGGGKTPCAKDANGHGAGKVLPAHPEARVAGGDGRAHEEPGF